MIITLYKKSILNSEYSEVFYNTNLLLNYLNTLQNKKVEISDIYPKLNGTIILSNINLLDAYEYNYIKIEGMNGTSFAFIDDIDVINNSAKIYYSMDVWSTFNGKWSLRDSLLSRTRFPDLYNTDFAYLPEKYMSNGKSEFIKLMQVNYYTVICKLRLYNTAKEGEHTYQGYVYAMLGYGNYNDGSAEEGNNKLSWIQANRVLSDLYSNMDRYKIFGNRFEGYYYEIDTSYIIPFNSIQNYFNYFIGIINVDGTTTSFNSTALWYSGLDSVEDYYTEIEENYEIPADDDVVGVGTYLNIVENSFDNNIKNIRIKLCLSSYDFRILMYVNGVANDITDYFNIDFPIGTLNASEAELKQLNRNLNNARVAINIVSGAIDIASNIYSPIAGSTSVLGNLANMRGRGINKQKIAGRQASYSSALENNIGGIGSGIAKVGNGIVDLIENNAPLYEVGYTNDVLPNGWINCYYGIGYWKVSDIINKNYIDNLVAETGYRTKKFIKEIMYINSDEVYDIVKFDFIRINGCTKIINDIISNILLNGTKIWYTIEVN